MKNPPRLALTSLLSVFLWLGCASCQSDAMGTTDGTGGTTGAGGTDGVVLDVDVTKLLEEGLHAEVSTETCTLSGGTVTTCYRITTTSIPAEHDIGPFCPRHISEEADVAGIWFEAGEVYDVDGTFIENLATFYDDPSWQLYDPSTGDVYVTDTQAACEGAARPDVDPQYQNHCVECDVSYAGADTIGTYVIPVTPVRSATSAPLGRNVVGLALNGVNFDPPAPTDAILSNYTIAALDDCGGHVNPVTGYHYHAATGCHETVEQGDGHAPLIGYGLDGHGIYALTGDDGAEPEDLDACRGHEDAVRGYHYHVASAGENLLVACFDGEHGCHFEGASEEPCDATQPSGPPAGPPG